MREESAGAPQQLNLTEEEEINGEKESIFTSNAGVLKVTNRLVAMATNIPVKKWQVE